MDFGHSPEVLEMLAPGALLLPQRLRRLHSVTRRGSRTWRGAPGDLAHAVLGTTYLS